MIYPGWQMLTSFCFDKVRAEGDYFNDITSCFGFSDTAFYSNTYTVKFPLNALPLIKLPHPQGFFY
jgi:hypothetical protein